MLFLHNCTIPYFKIYIAVTFLYEYVCDQVVDFFNPVPMMKK